MPNIRYIRLTLIWHTNNIPRITIHYELVFLLAGEKSPALTLQLQLGVPNAVGAV